MTRFALLTVTATVLVAANLPAQFPSTMQQPYDLAPSRPLQIFSPEQQKEVIDTLVQALHDSDPIIRSQATAGLLKIGEASVPSLLPLLESKDRLVKLDVAKIIFLMGDLDLHRKDALLALTKEVRTTDDAEFRRMAIMAMSNLAQAARVAIPPAMRKDFMPQPPKKDK